MKQYMCNVLTIDVSKISRKELENCTVSLEELFLREQSQFIDEMKKHEERYADADSWCTNKRNEDYLAEKMEMLERFKKKCVDYIDAMRLERFFMSNCLQIEE